MNDRKLKEYQQKRNPEKSGEPDGNTDNLSKEHVFVIQKHDASQLHYDFRLQVGDVLVSWAVPKGLSTAANEKHLAIQTEDHPLDYAKFEGVIPEGEYGAGTVLVWDIGDYSLLSVVIRNHRENVPVLVLCCLGIMSRINSNLLGAWAQVLTRTGWKIYTTK